MLRVSGLVRCGMSGQELYGPHSSLPRDFFDCLRNYFGATLHVPCYIGTRSSQLRGLFYGHGSSSSDSAAATTRSLPAIEANQPIVTVPLASVYTVDNIARKPNVLPHITLDAVRRAMATTGDAEFAPMAPQLYLGLQFSALVNAVPDVSGADDSDTLARVGALCRSQALPWARLLDDEDFNTEFVYGMYGSALDTWQRESYTELTSKYDAATAAIHGALQPLPFPLEHFRRITRLVLARVEHVPTLDSFDTHSSSSSSSVRHAMWRCARRTRRALHSVCAALSRQRRLPARVRAALTPRATTQLAMVPCIDLVNHSNRPNCAVRFARSPVLHGAPAATLYTLMRVLPGQELCRHYNFDLVRPVALFRYGFLPFDVISVVDIDAANEYVFKRRGDLVPESEEKLNKERRERDEVARLERLYQAARQSSSPSS